MFFYLDRKICGIEYIFRKAAHVALLNSEAILPNSCSLLGFDRNDKMLKLVVVTLVWLPVIFAFPHHHNHHHKRFPLHSPEKEHEVIEKNDVAWDHFMLVMEWPQSSCEYVNGSHQHHHCVINPLVKGWTLHGLWPSSTSGDDPFYCTTDKFAMNKVQDLEPDLDTYWPNMFTDTVKDSFWKHEYEKHGTCAGSVSRFAGEHSFFQQTMELRNKFDPMPILVKNGITPQASGYQFDEIHNALQSVFTSKICVECSFLRASHMQIFSGVYVCMAKDDQQQLVDCVKCEHSCNTDELVYYHPLHY